MRKPAPATRLYFRESNECAYCDGDDELTVARAKAGLEIPLCTEHFEMLDLVNAAVREETD